MRNITKEIVGAFNKGESKSLSNTKSTGSSLLLHGNKIAYRTPEGVVISNRGWFTPTTKERLNAIHGVSISQKKGLWYLNGKEWDGEEILIKGSSLGFLPSLNSPVTKVVGTLAVLGLGYLAYKKFSKSE